MLSLQLPCSYHATFVYIYWITCIFISMFVLKMHALICMKYKHILLKYIVIVRLFFLMLYTHLFLCSLDTSVFSRFFFYVILSASCQKGKSTYSHNQRYLIYSLLPYSMQSSLSWETNNCSAHSGNSQNFMEPRFILVFCLASMLIMD